MNEFIKQRDTYLAELLRLEGIGDGEAMPSCSECGLGQPGTAEGIGLFRCTTCSRGHLFCQNCLVRLHRFNVLHRIEV